MKNPFVSVMFIGFLSLFGFLLGADSGWCEQTLTYDANGNLISKTDANGTTTYTYDARNRLIAINGPGITASFTYDALNRRISKTVNGGTTGYWYDGTDVLAELSGSTPTATYIRSLSIDEPFVRKGASDEFYQTDALGSTLVLTDATGAPQTTYTYEPFGKTTVAGTSSNPFQYTGRENDGPGLYFYRARYYSTTLHRFVTEDPLEFTGGDTNLYSYVFDGPTNYTDPTGEIVPFLLICGRGALSSIGMDMLAGRKVDWLGAGIDCVTGGFGKIKQIRRLGDVTKKSPHIDPRDIAGKSPKDIDQIAKQKGLIPKGPDPMSGKGSYIDPVTGEQRVLIHPNDIKCGPHCHMNDPAGRRLDINGQVVAPESPSAHLPLGWP